MKIAVGMNIHDGPFGGGNQFGKSLSQYLTQKGHQVFFDLSQPDLDLILMTDPRTSMQSVAFGPLQIMRYVRDINPSVLLVQRINECDERKGTHGFNRLLCVSNKIMDHTVFISSWLEQLHRKQNPFTENSSVIKNGADRSIFIYHHKQLPTNRKIRLVTHHWSANWSKGWDVYQHIDDLLKKKKFNSEFEFHYIGILPKKISLQHIQLHPPCTGSELADLLHSCDIYLSASLNEPAGMHHIEGALCGLPLLYRNSGALPEYCQGYGIMFEGIDDVESALHELRAHYDFYAKKMLDYPYTSEKMCEEYLSLFTQLKEQQPLIINRRGRKKFSYCNQCRLGAELLCHRILSH